MEQIKDYNEYLREVIKGLHKRMTDHAAYVHNIKDKYVQDALFLDSMQTNEYEEQLISQFFHTPQEVIMQTNIAVTMIKYQLFIEYYKLLNLSDKLGDISVIGKNDLERLHSTDTPQKIIELTSELDTHIPFNMLNATLKYKSLSVYEKILQIKALSIEDEEKLTSINPFFGTEKNKYDIDVSLGFIKNRINMLNSGSFKDNNERTYNETVEFIYNLGKLRKKESECLLDEIIIESDNIKTTTIPENDDDMKCSYGYISKKELKTSLMNMTKKDSNPVKEKK